MRDAIASRLFLRPFLSVSSQTMESYIGRYAVMRGAGGMRGEARKRARHAPETPCFVFSTEQTHSLGVLDIVV
jgi:hypothetical protein